MSRTHTIGPDCWVSLPVEVLPVDADGNVTHVIYSATMHVSVPVVGDMAEVPAMVAIPQRTRNHSLNAMGTAHDMLMKIAKGGSVRTGDAARVASMLDAAMQLMRGEA